MLFMVSSNTTEFDTAHTASKLSDTFSCERKRLSPVENREISGHHSCMYQRRTRTGPAPIRTIPRMLTSKTYYLRQLLQVCKYGKDKPHNSRDECISGDSIRAGQSVPELGTPASEIQRGS